MRAGDQTIVVYGATGTVGALLARELADRGAGVIVAGRDAGRVEAVARELDVPARVAAVDDEAQLAAAVAGARVVVGCAGPFARVGEPVLAAAIAAGASYVDVAGEQAFLRAMYERYESAARRAGVTCVPGAGVAPGLGDLAAARAAAAVIGAEPGPSLIRGGPPGRLADDDPLDEIAVTWILDGVAAAPGAQRSGVEILAGGGGVRWQDGRWDPAPAGAERRTVNAGGELGGARVAISAPGGEVITVPRHVAVRRVQTFASVTRAAWAMRAAGLAARALPLLGARLGERLRRLTPAPPPTAAERARARFAVVARARRRFDEEEVIVRGADLYTAAAEIAAWIAVAVASLAGGPTGVLAPAELLSPGPALDALAAAAELEVVTSFGPGRAGAW